MAIKPIKKPEGQDYGVPNNAYKWNYHAGIDFPASLKTNIIAPLSGKYKYLKGDNGGYGNIVQLVDKRGFKHWMTHAGARFKKDATVKQGEHIGETGNTGFSTGPHLHWEVRWRNKDIHPDLWLEVVRNYEKYEKSINILTKERNALKSQLSNANSALKDSQKLVESLSERPTKEEVENLKSELKVVRSDLEQAQKEVLTIETNFIKRVVEAISKLVDNFLNNIRS